MKLASTSIVLALLACTAHAQTSQPETDITVDNKAEVKNNKSTYSEDNLNQDMAVIFSEKSLERQTSEVEFMAWNNQLNEFLLNSDDDFSKAMTLAKMVSDVKNAQLMATIQNKPTQLDALSNLDFQPLAHSLNQLIAQPKLSAATLSVLNNVCFTDEIAEYCHANLLLEKRMQQDTENLQSYLRPFALAQQAKDNQLMTQIFKLMAASKHSQIPQGISQEMAALIDEFIINNPIPASAVSNMIEDYRKLSGLSPEKKAQLDELMPQYMPSHIKFSYTHLIDSTPYRAILNYCQSHIGAVPGCRNIAETMIQKSNSVTAMGVGHALLIATYELERDAQGINAAKQLNDQFRQSYQCVTDLTAEKYFIDNYFDQAWQNISTQVTSELEMLIQLAELNYSKKLTQGDKSAVNPDQCFAEAEN